MKKLLLVLFTAFSIGAIAQPTLTTSILPGVGTVVNFTNWTSSADTGNAGANQTWTYTLTGAQTGSFTYVDASTAPDASMFPEANLAIADGTGGYQYFSSDGGSLSMVGMNSGGYIIDLSNIEEILSAPLDYQDSGSDDFSRILIVKNIRSYIHLDLTICQFIDTDGCVIAAHKSRVQRTHEICFAYLKQLLLRIGIKPHPVHNLGFYSDADIVYIIFDCAYARYVRKSTSVDG